MDMFHRKWPCSNWSYCGSVVAQQTLHCMQSREDSQGENCNDLEQQTIQQDACTLERSTLAGIGAKLGTKHQTHDPTVFFGRVLFKLICRSISIRANAIITLLWQLNLLNDVIHILYILLPLFHLNYKMFWLFRYINFTIYIDIVHI